MPTSDTLNGVSQRFASGSDEAVLYVNPADADTFASMHNANRVYTNDFGHVSRVTASVYNMGGSVGSFVFDEIRIGTTPEDMFSVIPEPATLAMLALGGLAVLRRRRK